MRVQVVDAPVGLAVELSRRGADVVAAELPARDGVDVVVVRAATLGGAGAQGDVAILALFDEPAEASASAMVGARAAPFDASPAVLAAAVAALAGTRRPPATDSSAVVESLQEQLRSLIERRQGWDHEVRTPLGIIRSNAANLRDGIDGPLTDDQRESVDSILDAATQLERLLERDRYTRPNIPALQGSLDTLRRQRRGARVTAGGGRQRTELVPLVRGVLGQFAAQAASRGAELSFSASGAVPDVWLDPVKITQLLSNLVGNALKHTPPGSRVTVLLVDEPVGDVLAMPAVRLSVLDGGQGIPEELLERIFERGVRVFDGADAPAGRGLGLTVSRDLVAAHGGKLWAENRSRGGAVFHAVLPVDLRAGRNG